MIESWHSTVEFELRMLEHFTTKAQARARVAAWIEDYNHDPRKMVVMVVVLVNSSMKVRACCSDPNRSGN